MLGMFAERMCRVGIMVDNVFHEKGKIKTSYLKLYNHGFSFLFTLTLKIAAAAAVTSVVSDSVRPHRQQPTRLPSLGFSRQEHWSGLPFPSSMYESEK